MPPAFDAIVVLGAAIRSDGTPGLALIRRLDDAIHLFHQHRAPFLLLTGGAVAGPPPEAHLMADLARRAGVPDPAIIVEDAATTTMENAQFSAALMSKWGWRRVLLVSDGHHLPRAILAFRAVGIQASGSAVPGVFAASPALYILESMREMVACAFYAARLIKARCHHREQGRQGR